MSSSIARPKGEGKSVLVLKRDGTGTISVGFANNRIGAAAYLVDNKSAAFSNFGRLA